MASARTCGLLLWLGTVGSFLGCSSYPRPTQPRYWDFNAPYVAAQRSRPATPASPWDVTLRYERPTAISRWGRRVAVAPFENEGESMFSQRISEAIGRIQSLEVVTDRTEIGITGNVIESVVSPDVMSEHPSTCRRVVQRTRTRQVPYEVEDPPPRRNPNRTREGRTRRVDEALDDMTLGFGGRRTHTEYREEQYTVPEIEQYACTELRRNVDVAFVVRIRVAVRSRPIRVVYDREVRLTDQRQTTGVRGSDDDREPGTIDGQALLRTLWERARDQFVTEALPTPEDVQVRFEDCRNPRCESAVNFARGGNMEDAERELSEVIRALTVRRPRRSEQLAAAHYNRGLVRGFGRRLNDGIADLVRATSLAPGHTDWENRLTSFRELQRSLGPSPRRH